MKFSHDGKFLATAGQDRLVFIWKVKPGRGEDAAGPSSAEANSPGKETEQPRNGSNAGDSPWSSADPRMLNKIDLENFF